jgi:ribosomal protein S18 acetylase RimI-like enzyme
MQQQSMHHAHLWYREDVLPGDREVVREIITSSGFFSPQEVGVAVELVEVRLAQGLRSGYYFLFAEHQGAVVGYTCFGPIPGTAVSFDLYWIAVHNQYRSMGIGTALLTRSERKIARLGGQRVYIETSSRPLYAPTHAFYRAHSYCQAALLEDYYAPGDAKVIYVKVLPPEAGGTSPRTPWS